MRPALVRVLGNEVYRNSATSVSMSISRKLSSATFFVSLVGLAQIQFFADSSWTHIRERTDFDMHFWLKIYTKCITYLFTRSRIYFLTTAWNLRNTPRHLNWATLIKSQLVLFAIWIIYLIPFTAHRTSTFKKIHFLSFYRVYSIIICCSYTEVLFCGATTTFYCYYCYYYCYNYYNSSREFNFRVILISSQSRIKPSRTRAIHRRSKSKVLFRIQDMEL